MILQQTIGGVSRTFIVKTYALQHALKKLDASIMDIEFLLQFKFFDLIFWMLYYSAEYPLYKEDKATDFTEKDVYEWVDELGGYNGKFMSDFTKAIFANLGVSQDGAPEGEKKKKAPVKGKQEKHPLST